MNIKPEDFIAEGKVLGRRIAEIIYDKNGSPRDFANRVTFCAKDAFYRSLKGVRYFKPTELQELSQLLRIPLDRITIKDNYMQHFELRNMVKREAPFLRAINLGHQLLESAIGWTEKFNLHNDLGSAYYFLKNFEEAHAHWLEAYSYAEKIHEKFCEPDLLYKVTCNLLISYTDRSEFQALDLFLNKVQPEFRDSNPKRAGTLALSQGMIARNIKDVRKARMKFQESLEHFRKTKDQYLIGIGLHNLAYDFYLGHDYQNAKLLFEESIHTLTPYEISKSVSILDYVKTLIKLKYLREAREWIQPTIETLEHFDEPNLLAKFYIVDSLASHDPLRCEKVFELSNVNTQVQLVACKLLMSHYSRMDDPENVMRYYKLAETIDSSATIADWEVMQ